MTIKSSERIFNVHALRALAAMLVAYSHCETYCPGWERFGRFSHAGSEGVTLFFVISGFIMVFTTTIRNPDCVTFIAGRISRIVPLYWLITLAVFLIALIKPSLMNSTHANVIELLKSLAFIPYVKESGLVQPIVFVGWSLNYEMFFYGLFGLGLLVPKKTHAALATMSILIALVVVGVWIPSQSVATHFFTRPVMLEFGLGMALGLLWRSHPGRILPSSLALSVMITSVVLIIALPADILSIANAGYGLISALIVGSAIALERNGLILRWRWLQHLGDASYAIYLSHFFITIAVDHVLRHSPASGPAVVAILVATLAACALLGLVIHHLIELPLTRAARRVLLPRPPATLPSELAA